jgi:hypothetical protein
LESDAADESSKRANKNKNVWKRLSIKCGKQKG